jgi:hypothetical protein
MAGSDILGSRRQVIAGLAAAAGTAMTGPVRAQSFSGLRQDPLLPDAAASLPPAPPTSIAPDPAYDRKVLDVAQRERERHAAILWRADTVAVADFARPSSLPRLHFVDLEGGKIRSFYVAHGKGSDPEHDGWLKIFSNAMNSEATSRGAYLTGSWYDGKYGTSIRLRGLEADNSLAEDRAIVMHPAWYAAPEMVAKWGKLGRSEGCFAMAPTEFDEALLHLAGGRLLFADRIV